MTSHPRQPAGPLFTNGGRRHALWLFAAAFGALAPSAGAQTGLESPTRPKLVYAGDAYFPPFEYKDEKGRARGFNIELVSLAAEDAGYEVEFRLESWPQAVASLNEGRADLAAGRPVGRALVIQAPVPISRSNSARALLGSGATTMPWTPRARAARTLPS